MPREYSSSSSSRSSHYPSDAKSSSQGNWCPLYLPTFSIRTPHTSQPINYTDSQLISYHITEKAYKPSGSTTKSSGSTTKSSSHRTSSNPKVVIDYPSTYKDPDRRSKYQDSSYLPWGIRFPPLVLEHMLQLQAVWYEDSDKIPSASIDLLLDLVCVYQVALLRCWFFICGLRSWGMARQYIADHDFVWWLRAFASPVTIWTAVIIFGLAVRHLFWVSSCQGVVGFA